MSVSFRILRRISLLTVTSIVVLMLAGVALMQSSYVQTKVINLVCKQFDTVNIKVQKSYGILPFNLILENVVIRKPNKNTQVDESQNDPFVKINRVALKINKKDLLKGKFSFQKIKIGTIEAKQLSAFMIKNQTEYSPFASYLKKIILLRKLVHKNLLSTLSIQHFDIHLFDGEKTLRGKLEHFQKDLDLTTVLIINDKQIASFVTSVVETEELEEQLAMRFKIDLPKELSLIEKPISITGHISHTQDDREIVLKELDIKSDTFHRKMSGDIRGRDDLTHVNIQDHTLSVRLALQFVVENDEAVIKSIVLKRLNATRQLFFGVCPKGLRYSLDPEKGPMLSGVIQLLDYNMKEIEVFMQDLDTPLILKTKDKENEIELLISPSLNEKKVVADLTVSPLSSDNLLVDPLHAKFYVQFTDKLQAHVKAQKISTRFGVLKDVSVQYNDRDTVHQLLITSQQRGGGASSKGKNSKQTAGQVDATQPSVHIDVAVDKALKLVKIDSLDVHYQDLNFILNKAFKIKIEPKIQIQSFDLCLKEKQQNIGLLQFNAHEYTLYVNDLRLRFLKYFFEDFMLDGLISGKFDLTKEYLPQIGHLQLADIKFLDADLTTSQWVKHMSICADFKQEKDCFNFKFEQYHLGKKNTPVLKMYLDILQGKHCHSFFEGAHVQGHMTGVLNVANLMSIFPMPDRIAGLLHLNLKITGALPMPNINGYIDVENGLYDSFMNGTYIQKLKGRILAENGKLRIDKSIDGIDFEISKKDSKEKKYIPQGTLSITGGAVLTQGLSIEPDLLLTLQNLTVVKRDDMFMRASGKINLKGKGLHSKISGSVELNPSVIYMEELTDDDVTTINLLKKGKVQPTKKEKKITFRRKQRKVSPLFPIDLELKAGEHFVIKGRGVHSYWRGSLHASGDFSDGAPYLSGDLHLKKGQMSFFGKKLTITQGKIRYTAEDENNPHLTLVASKRQDNYILKMMLKGWASESPVGEVIRFSFSSLPALPQESVLSMMLFGKKSNQISAGQSMQMASAAALVNSSGKSGFNVIEGLRSMLGLDILELKENERLAQLSDNGQTTSQTLSIGKQFGDMKIYFDHGLGSQGNKATLSKPIANNVYIDVDVGDQLAGSGGGVSWVHQY